MFEQQDWSNARRMQCNYGIAEELYTFSNNVRLERDNPPRSLYIATMSTEFKNLLLSFPITRHVWRKAWSLYMESGRYLLQFRVWNLLQQDRWYRASAACKSLIAFASLAKTATPKSSLRSWHFASRSSLYVLNLEPVGSLSVATFEAGSYSCLEILGSYSFGRIHGVTLIQNKQCFRKSKLSPHNFLELVSPTSSFPRLKGSKFLGFT